MVEVFKTSVTEPGHAINLLHRIHENFTSYEANFDLEDCDRILRVECATGPVQSASLIALLKDFGVYAEVLPDDIPAYRALYNELCA